jgi:ribosomal protein L12E/L44/L45/RPP1/RPP2
MFSLSNEDPFLKICRQIKSIADTQSSKDKLECLLHQCDLFLKKSTNLNIKKYAICFTIAEIHARKSLFYLQDKNLDEALKSYQLAMGHAAEAEEYYDDKEYANNHPLIKQSNNYNLSTYESVIAKIEELVGNPLEKYLQACEETLYKISPC